MKVEYKLITDGEKFAVLRIERGWLKGSTMVYLDLSERFVRLEAFRESSGIWMGCERSKIIMARLNALKGF